MAARAGLRREVGDRPAGGLHPSDAPPSPDPHPRRSTGGSRRRKGRIAVVPFSSCCARGRRGREEFSACAPRKGLWHAPSGRGCFWRGDWILELRTRFVPHVQMEGRAILPVPRCPGRRSCRSCGRGQRASAEHGVGARGMRTTGSGGDRRRWSRRRSGCWRVVAVPSQVGRVGGADGSAPDEEPPCCCCADGTGGRGILLWNGAQ